MLGANNAASAAASAASSSTASSDALPSHQKLLDFVSGLTSTSRDGRRGATGDGRSGGGGATRAAEETEAGTESEVRLLNTSFTRLRATRLSNLSLATASICSALALLCFGSLMVELCFAHAPLAHSWPCVACPCSTCPCCLLFAHDTHVPSGLRPPLPLFSLSSLTLTLLPLPHTNSPRSQFTATGSGASLSVEALAASLMNPGGAGGDAMNPELHSTLQRLSRTSGKLSAPAGRPMQERMTRKVAYDETSKEVGRWQPVVKDLRETETVSFPLNAAPRVKLSQADLAEKFTPESAMEEQVQAILSATNTLDEAAVRKREHDELEANHLSAEDVAARKTQLRQLRALMFYEEQKNKRVKKIKSKLYRKIRKKQKQKMEADVAAQMGDLDPEWAREEEEAQAMTRAQERFTLKHKNMGKWAKQAIKRGGTTNEGVKEALNDHVKLDGKLRRKMNKMHTGDNSDSDTDDDSDDEHGDENGDRLGMEARKVLEEMDTEREAEGTTQHKSLMALKFMQRARDKQRDRAEADVNSMLTAMERGEGGEDEFGEDGMGRGAGDGGDDAAGGAPSSGRRTFGGTEGSSGSAGPTASAATKRAVRGMLPNGSLQVRQVAESSGRSAKVAGAVTVQPRADLFEEVPFEVPDAAAGAAGTAGKRKRGSGNAASASAAAAGASSSSNGKAAAKGKTAKGKGKAGGVSGEKEEEEEDSEEEKAATTRSSRSASAAAAKAANGKAAKGKGGGGVEEADGEANGYSLTLKDTGETDGAGAKNPWLDPLRSTTGKREGLSKKQKKGAKQGAGGQGGGILDVQGAVGGLAGESKDSKKESKEMAQADLVRRAFSTGDTEKEFAKEKEGDIAREERDSKQGKRAKKVPARESGWGSWTGMGAKVSKPRVGSSEKQEAKAKKRRRKDDSLSHVVINEKRNKKASIYSVSRVPHPFTSREQYEASLRAPVGQDWNTTESHRRMTAPEVKFTAGSIIDPIKFGKKAKNLLDADMKSFERKKKMERNAQRKKRTTRGL